jgi:hypothetical protein
MSNSSELFAKFGSMRKQVSWDCLFSASTPWDWENLSVLEKFFGIFGIFTPKTEKVGDSPRDCLRQSR